MLKDGKGDIRISDHALIRYMERVLNLYLDKLRQEIIDEIDLGTFGEAIFPSKTLDMKTVVKNFTVITITLL